MTCGYCNFNAKPRSRRAAQRIRDTRVDFAGRYAANATKQGSPKHKTLKFVLVLMFR